MVVTLKKTIPSNSHNAAFNTELGSHWPQGEQFKLLSKSEQIRLRKVYRIPAGRTILQQAGGEEVLLTIPSERFAELFGD